jgi:HPr kinase/phosphorylase
VTTPLTIGRIIEHVREILQLAQIGPGGLDRPVPGPDVSSPGLALAGYVNRFPGSRLQVLGETEVTYLASLGPVERGRVLDLYFSFALPALFITKAQEPPEGLAERARRADIPLFRSPLKTAEFYRRIKPILENLFAPTTSLHGSLAHVFGVGVFFTRRSGIGKSECVLDLVERGHRLVADDLVMVSRRGNDVLIGRGHELQRHYMEIRGIGLIDIPGIFGIRAVRQQKRIEVIVQLEEWDQDAVVDRTGLDRDVTTVLDVQLPLIRIFLNPGKNITVIAEVIAMNHLLRYSGVDPAAAFNDRLMKRMRQAADVRQYLAQDDE